MKNNLLIVGGLVADPLFGKEEKRDLVVRDGIITELLTPAEGEDRRKEWEKDSSFSIIRADGKYVLPGLVDVHVHFRDPGFTYKEDIETGARAAAAGGVTSVVLMANTKPSVDNEDTLSYVIEKGRKTDVHIYTCCSVTKNLAGEELTDIEKLISLGAVGATDDGIPIMDEEMLRRAMQIAARLAIPISLHEEDKSYITNNGINEGEASAHFGIKGSPRDAEISLVRRDLAIAIEEGACLNIQHISSKEAVSLVREAKKKSDKIHAEATPHHIALTEEAVLSKGTLAKMNPPLRTKEDRLAILEGLSDGTIDLIATDHAPHSQEEKAAELTKAPSGITGLETALSICYNSLVKEGHLSMAALMEKMSLNPARMYHLPAGTLSVGEAADICIFDPEAEWVYDKTFSKSVNSPFYGEKLRGKVVTTIADGRVIYRAECD